MKIVSLSLESDTQRSKYIDDMSRVEQYLWALDFNEYWQCYNCDKVSGFREMYSDQLRNVRQITREIFAYHHQQEPICPCCSSTEGSLCHEPSNILKDIQYRQERPYFNATMIDDDDCVQGMCEGYVVSAEQAWQREMSRYYPAHQQQHFYQQCQLQHDDDVIVWSTIGISEDNRSMSAAIDLVDTFVRSISDQYKSCMVVGETDRSCRFFPFVVAGKGREISLSGHENCVVYGYPNVAAVIDNINNVFKKTSFLKSILRQQRKAISV